jgi:hypothetical protein
MKPMIIFMSTMIVLLATQAYAADSGPSRAYYDACINRKITDCQKIAHLFRQCSNPRMESLRTMRSRQADFYREHKSQLVEQMMKNGLGTRLHRIDYFLITEFKNGGRLQK